MKRSLKISKVYESLLSSRSFQFVYEHVYNEYKCLANVLFSWIPDHKPITSMYFNCIVFMFYLVSFFLQRCFSQSVYFNAAISLANHYHNIAGKVLILTDCYRRCSCKAFPEFVCIIPKENSNNLNVFWFGITHTIITSGILVKAIATPSLVTVCLDEYGNGLQVI